ncbi:MAG: hypothetical protein COW65_08885 [Cytophagales bacterium CG18_big_fil_WC_8_21_14_2_50_42_9]|nr:MAG: hypothetical protein COW65_08885 [Cytophagales bacterium CG18_big_fil_WC_8_21_14_2_50_42_9]
MKDSIFQGSGANGLFLPKNAHGRVAPSLGFGLLIFLFLLSSECLLRWHQKSQEPSSQILELVLYTTAFLKLCI